MDPIEVLSYILHSVFAGVWAGSVVFVALVVLPMARDGSFNAAPLEAITGKLVTISRVSALVLFITGSHMAAQVYTADTLVETTPGQLVLAMIVLWLVLMGTVEVGAKKIREGTDRDKVREPARNARPFMLVASLSAVLLLVTAGLISASRLGFFTI